MRWGMLIAASSWLVGGCLTPAREGDGGPHDAGIDAGGFAPDLTQTDEFTGHRAALDLLWVIDTGSQDDVKAQQSILGDLTAFLSVPFQSGIDLHMAVTSTDLYGGPNSEDGRMLPCPGCKVDGPAMRVIDSSHGLAGAVLELASLLDLGIADGCPGPNPRGFACEGLLLESIYEALSPAALTGYNKPFYRSEAYLGVVLVTGDNVDDRSPLPSSVYFDWFWSLKGTGPPFPARNAILGSTFSLLSPGLAVQHPLTKTQFVQLTNGALADLDDTGEPNWKDELNALWPQDYQSSTMFEYPLSKTPLRGTIHVLDDDLDIPETQNGSLQWSYDDRNNAVLFAPPAFPFLGDRVQISYTVSR